MALSKSMKMTLINTRLNGSFCNGLPTARALINRKLAFIREGTDSVIELTELGVQTAENLWHEENKHPLPTETYQEALELEEIKNKKRQQFVNEFNSHLPSLLKSFSYAK